MSFDISFPEGTITIIDSIRGAIGREVDFMTVAFSGCPVCTEDPETETSTNTSCLVCSGIYWIPEYTSNTVSGHITWGEADQLNWVRGGQLQEGDCRVQIRYDEGNLTILNTLDHLIVDGKTLEVQSTAYRGVQPLNRIILMCKERDK